MIHIRSPLKVQRNKILSFSIFSSLATFFYAMRVGFESDIQSKDCLTYDNGKTIGTWIDQWVFSTSPVWLGSLRVWWSVQWGPFGPGRCSCNFLDLLESALHCPNLFSCLSWQYRKMALRNQLSQLVKVTPKLGWMDQRMKYTCIRTYMSGFKTWPHLHDCHPFDFHNVSVFALLKNIRDIDTFYHHRLPVVWCLHHIVLHVIKPFPFPDANLSSL